MFTTSRPPGDMCLWGINWVADELVPLCSAVGDVVILRCLPIPRRVRLTEYLYCPNIWTYENVWDT